MAKLTKRQRNPKGQLRMDKPETLETLVTQDKSFSVLLHVLMNLFFLIAKHI